jgi:hypothetical protein
LKLANRDGVRRTLVASSQVTHRNGAAWVVQIALDVPGRHVPEAFLDHVDGIVRLDDAVVAAAARVETLRAKLVADKAAAQAWVHAEARKGNLDPTPDFSAVRETEKRLEEAETMHAGLLDAETTAVEESGSLVSTHREQWSAELLKLSDGAVSQLDTLVGAVVAHLGSMRDICRAIDIIAAADGHPADVLKADRRLDATLATATQAAEGAVDNARRALRTHTVNHLRSATYIEEKPAPVAGQPVADLFRLVGGVTFPAIPPGVVTPPMNALEKQVSAVSANLAELARRDSQNGGPARFTDRSGRVLFESDPGGRGLAAPEMSIPLYPATPGVVFISSATFTPAWYGEFPALNSGVMVGYMRVASYGGVGAAPVVETFVRLTDLNSSWTTDSIPQQLTGNTTTVDVTAYVQAGRALPPAQIGHGMALTIFARVVSGGASCAVAVAPRVCKGVSSATATNLGSMAW